MPIAEFPRGNAVAFPVALAYRTGSTSAPVANLADAEDIVVHIGPNPAEPELTLDLAGGKITVDSPDAGTITIALLSTDTIGLTPGRHMISVQVRYSIDSSNIVEWPAVPVFRLVANNIPPEAA